MTIPREGYVQVDGGRIWYRIVGGGTRIPLLLLHGGPGLPSYYLEPLATMADERPVIFYDQLGSGKSDKPSQQNLWCVERFVHELSKLRTALVLNDLHILGHSWGAMLAVDYMLTKPTGVRSLILASPGLSINRWLSDVQKLKQTLSQLTQAVIEENERAGTFESREYQAALMEYNRMYLSHRDPWPEAVTKSLADINQSVHETMWGSGGFTPTGSLRTYERAERLKELNLPVLFTAGRYDDATPESVDHYRSLTPGARLQIFEHSGHFTMNDEPEAYVEAIRSFLHEVEQQ